MRQTAHKAIILSGPSGSGKTTIASHLLANNKDLGFSVSACTRAKRPQELHGKDYYFLSVSEFQRKIAQGAFIEWEEVYAGRYYGTLKAEVANLWNAGKVAVFDIDVQGGIQLKSYFKERALAVYVQVPSIQLLAERLAKRQTEPAEEIMLRMSRVEREASLAAQFDAILINEELQTCLKNAQTLLDEFLKG